MGPDRMHHDGLPHIMRSKKSSEGFITSELDLGLGESDVTMESETATKHDNKVCCKL